MRPSVRLSARLAMAAAALSTAVWAAQEAPPAKKPLDQLVQAERQFSATSVAEGMKAAFVTWLADTSVVFRPLPMDGKKLWVSRDSVPGTLVWEPSYAEVAASGDFGFTTGPWEFHPAPGRGDTTIATGHFVSVWRKQASGDWRVVLDIGVQHERPERGVGSGDFERGPESKAVHRKTALDLPALDRTLAAATREHGVAAGFSEHVAPGFWLDRDGFLPNRGAGSLQEAFAQVKGALEFETRGSGASGTGDLAYTYGLARLVSANAAPDSGVYVHLWRREAGKPWKLALAVENPL